MANSFTAIRVYWSPLEAAVNKLIEDLAINFGPPKEFKLERAKDEPKGFPAMRESDTIIGLPP